MKRIAILGSTGSIGTQALQVIAEHPDLFQVEVLTANDQVNKLIEQARCFNPDAVVIANEDKYATLRDALIDLPIKVYAGADALCEVVESGSIDIVLMALVGFAGLRPTLHAIRSRKLIALANKETLVVAGELVTQLARQYRAPILPVDSEHSAIFQSLVGEGQNEIDKILLTASGGPFREFSAEQLRHVTPAQALHHPNWKMGAKITIDSATMMNKGFEVIEARWLFGVDAKQIEVLVHPQSVVHSAVQFRDGAVKAQLGVPDMRLPIQYALTYPDRLPLSGERLDLFQLHHLTFEHPDMEKFPCLGLAYEALRRGGNAPCVLNRANEVMNLAFRQGKIAFENIYTNIEKVMEMVPFEQESSFDAYIATDEETHCVAEQLITKQQ
ncbi:MAG: 1-deoxy-D-xylulose-5-phosphate reductoisomerase [Bacteroidaceae bacterium]|jgi:1-deoxy-D-xylulose-5-phosphate reductoisomerase|nr:1-deoxy-D-xylulose-5-phosphate reductoisomerase [Bacteroidaceae bacterium]